MRSHDMVVGAACSDCYMHSIRAVGSSYIHREAVVLMARATTPTIMTLDRFGQLLGFNPLHFNQVILNNRNIDEGWSCGQTISQYGWQAAGRIGREEIAIAIHRAEEDLASELGFDVGPRWRKAEIVDIPQQHVAHGLWWSSAIDAKLPRGYVLEGGIEAKTEIELGATIVYSNKYGGLAADDVYQETATIVVASSVTDPQEIAIYYPGTDGDEAWEIKPIKVEIGVPSAGSITITCRREQLVLPEIIEDVSNWHEVDGMVDDNFLEEVDVYRHYNDPSQQVMFLWESGQGGGWHDIFGLLSCGCGGSGCTTCGYTTQSGCLLVHNRRRGQVHLTPGTWDDTAEPPAWSSAQPTIAWRPGKALVWYRAGFYDPNKAQPYKEINAAFESATMALALAYISRPICGCDGIKDLHEYYATDFAEVSGDAGGSLSYTTGYVDNPFGSKRGCIEAWKKVRSLGLGRGVNVYA